MTNSESNQDDCIIFVLVGYRKKDLLDGHTDRHSIDRKFSSAITPINRIEADGFRFVKSKILEEKFHIDHPIIEIDPIVQIIKLKSFLIEQFEQFIVTFISLLSLVH